MDFVKILNDKAQNLNRQQRILLGTLYAEKLLSNYAYFSLLHKWGNIEPLQTVLVYLYQNINKPFSVKKLRSLYKLVDKVTPDTDDFEHFSVSSALDACCVILETLDYLLDKNDRHIESIISLVRDTVDMYVQEKNNMDIDENREMKILEDFHMIKMFKWQFETIEAIQRLSSFDVEYIKLLRKNSNAELLIDFGLIK